MSCSAQHLSPVAKTGADSRSQTNQRTALGNSHLERTLGPKAFAFRGFLPQTQSCKEIVKECFFYENQKLKEEKQNKQKTPHLDLWPTQSPKAGTKGQKLKNELYTMGQALGTREQKILPGVTTTPQEVQLTWEHHPSPHHSAPGHPSYLPFYKRAFKDSISHYF